MTNEEAAIESLKISLTAMKHGMTVKKGPWKKYLWAEYEQEIIAKIAAEYGVPAAWLAAKKFA